MDSLTRHLRNVSSIWVYKKNQILWKQHSKPVEQIPSWRLRNNSKKYQYVKSCIFYIELPNMPARSRLWFQYSNNQCEILLCIKQTNSHSRGRQGEVLSDKRCPKLVSEPETDPLLNINVINILSSTDEKFYHSSLYQETFGCIKLYASYEAA